MPKSKKPVGRPRKEAEYANGTDAARAFDNAFDAILTVSKPCIVALEKKAKTKQGRGK
jgi:hypothetical protein